MRRIIGVTAAALMLAPAAYAGHTYPGDPHWPTTTVQVNGGSCGWAKPECRWLRIIDRTGFGQTWQNTILPNALDALTAATGYRFNFTSVRGTRVDLMDGADAGFALAPTASVFLGRHNVGSGYTTWRTCQSLNSEPSWPQPYCGTNGNHMTEGVIALGNNDSYMIRHELGHVFGLDHRTGTSSIMAGYCCAFDQHDRDMLAFLYGHTP